MKNTVTRVSAPDTTEGTKRRNAEIAAEAAAREKAEIEYYRSMLDPNNQSAEAMAFRDGPIQSLTPDVVEMIALGKPTEWALKAAGKYVVKPAMKKAGGAAKKTIDESLDFGGGIVDAVPAGALNPKYMSSHAMSGKSFLKALDSGHLSQPSIAISPAGKAQLLEPYNTYGSTGYPDVVLTIPDSVFKKNTKAVIASDDVGTPTMSELKKLFESAKERGMFLNLGTKPMPRDYDVPLFPKEFIDKSFDDVMADNGLRRLLYDSVRPAYRFDHPTMAKAMDPVGGPVRQGSLTMYNGSDVVGALPDDFADSLGKSFYGYGEVKVLDDVPLKNVLTEDRTVILNPTRGMTKEGADEIVKRLENSGIKYRWLGENIRRRELNKSIMDAGPLHEDAKGGQSADVRAATKGGDGGGETQVEAPVQESAAPVSDGGPRIVINPSTFHNEKDALCVAYNEALRIVMEENGFDPVSEPTDAQREFFADTAYADDELMLRRTILARICVFDTSVKDPTDEQLEEAVEFLETVMEIGAPQNAQEQSVVQRAHDIIARTLQGSRQGQGAQGAGAPQGQTGGPREPGNPSASTEEPQSEPQPLEPRSEEPLSEPPM